jgi:hypothetical protein
MSLERVPCCRRLPVSAGQIPITGHTVFPLLAMLLSTGAIGDALTKELDATALDPVESSALTDIERTRTPHDHRSPR